MRGEIAGAARAVSAEMVKAAIAVTPASSGAEERKNSKDRRRWTIIIFSLFSVSLLYLTKTSFLSRLAMQTPNNHIGLA